jgi:hypothetical protein
LRWRHFHGDFDETGNREAVARDYPTSLEASFTNDFVTFAARLWTGLVLMIFYEVECL